MLFKTVKLFLIIAIAFAALVIATDGRGVKYAVENRYHTVAAGQNVWGIATRYLPMQDKTRDVRELVYDIGRVNNLRGYHIEPGQRLVIPLEVEVKETAEERGWALLPEPAF